MQVLSEGVGVMPESKRQCSKCLFFQKAQLSGNGWCTHPKRQVASDLKILVRERELACRNSWGDDLWVDAQGASTRPLPADPVPAARPGRFVANLQPDDEVTSVVDTAARHDPGPGLPAPAGRPAGLDDVVTFTSVRGDEAVTPRPASPPAADDHNAPAIADQAERARLIARGNRDAILKARERHSQRQKPDRTTIAPDDIDLAIDRVIAAQDRDQSLPPESNERTRADRFRDTPPVPREEVEARGNSSAAAVGTDARFDSKAEVRPEVDLSQLRGFLTGAGPGRQSPATGSGEMPTSFDLVLRRAREIKDATEGARASRDPHPESATRPPRVTVPKPQAPGSASQASRHHDSRVIWDVSGERLNVAFERARVAIDAPVSPRAPHHASGPRPAAPEPHHETAGLVAVGDHAAIDVDDAFDDAPDFDSDDAFGTLEQDDEWLDPQPETYEPARKRESPRGSWWRSLNFGRKRRYHPLPDREPSAWEVPRDGAGTVQAADEGFDVALVADDVELDWDDNDQRDYGAEGAAESPPSRYATSDDSWAQDVREFPEPQPAGWRQARAQVLARGPVREPASAAAAVALVDRSPVEARALEVDGAVHIDDLPERRPAPPGTTTTYAVDEPAGMDAYLAAVFESNAVPADADHQVPLPRMTRGLDDPGKVPELRPSRSTTNDGPSRHAGRGGRFATARYAFDTEFDIRDAIDDQDAIVEQHFDVASRVPKACGTCRSFRPTETGDRGWCMNDWSRTYRQMVDADDLACRSSIGDWWLATDNSWIPPTATIRPETPRTNRLESRLDELESETRATGHYVRTGNLG